MLCLMAFVAGCASPQTVTERFAVYTPASLYPACETPEHKIETNGDLARAYMDLRDSLRFCRQGVEALRDWSRNDEQVTQ